MRAYYEEASLGELFSELSQQAGMLVREEVDLARTELTHSAKRAGMARASSPLARLSDSPACCH